MVFGQETLWDGVRRTMRRVRKSRVGTVLRTPAVAARVGPVAAGALLTNQYGHLVVPTGAGAIYSNLVFANNAAGSTLPLWISAGTTGVTIQDCTFTDNLWRVTGTTTATGTITIRYDDWVMAQQQQWHQWPQAVWQYVEREEDRHAVRVRCGTRTPAQDDALAQQDQQAWRHWNGQYWSALEEKALTEEQQRALDRERQERRARAVRAVERAKRLFFSVLTDQQRADFDQLGRFTVQARESGRRYVIRASVADGRHGNIQELGHDGRPVASLCCAPGGNIPHFDAILGQKLALELDEAAFRRTANFTPLVPGYRREAA